MHKAKMKEEQKGKQSSVPVMTLQNGELIKLWR